MKKKPNIRILIAALSLIILQACRNGSDRERSHREETEKIQGQRLEVAEELPEKSIYQLEGEWHDQTGDTVKMKQLRGKIPVMAMIFTHCEFACPRIVADMKKLSDQLPPDRVREVVFVLVSFDTERDKPRRLKEFAEKMDLGNNWLLLHGEDETVRMLSMLLDIKYRKQAGGTFAHSNVITLLDRSGVIVRQEEGLGVNTSRLLEAISHL